MEHYFERKLTMFKRALIVTPVSLLAAGLITWNYVERNYSKADRIMLRVGMDPEYHKIVSKKPKNKD
jgi:hypothetical protein